MYIGTVASTTSNRGSQLRSCAGMGVYSNSSRVYYATFIIIYSLSFCFTKGLDVVFSLAVGQSSGSIAGAVTGAVLGVSIFIFAPICIGVCIACRSKKNYRVPHTTTVTQPQPPAPVSTFATTSFITTPPRVFTVQPPPSFAASSQYPIVDTAQIPQQPPPSYDDLFKYPQQQQFDPSLTLVQAPNPPPTQ